MGHFAGIMFRNDLVDQEDPVLAAHTAVANGVAVPQYELELLLAEHCVRLGVEIRRGVAVRGVRGDLRDEADVVVETDAGEFTAGWVVAADGGRSVLRKQLGVDFAGTEPELVGYQAIVDLDDTSGLSHGWMWTPRGVYAYGPIPGRILVARFGLGMGRWISSDRREGRRSSWRWSGWARDASSSTVSLIGGGFAAGRPMPKGWAQAL
ncbi:FAD-dependent monooxygenase [Amycolatopsis lurida]